jgi:pSer/pThr/pTyr-binding forkhead associated (FHA) protein
MPSLYILENDKQIDRVQLPTGSVTLGRLKSNTIVLDNPGVSRHHLRIDGDPSATQFVLEDLNSLNGTYMGPRRVQAVFLQNGDEIHLGKHTLVFEDN